MYEVVEERAFLLLVVIVGGHRIAVVFAQAITCSYPDISFVIFCKRLHFLIGQSVLAVDMQESDILCHRTAGREKERYERYDREDISA